MAEKRFTGEFDKQYSGVHDNGEQLTNFEVVDLLNNLSEENEQLKDRIDFYNISLKKLQDLTERKINENEQLKNHIQELQKHCKRLENENIQTYDLIKEAYNNERTQLGKSVLKQLLEAIQ